MKNETTVYPAVITHIDQRTWIINFGGVLKSETELTIENRRGQAVDANGEGIILRFNEIKGKGLRVFADGELLKASEDINSRESLYCFQIGF